MNCEPFWPKCKAECCGPCPIPVAIYETNRHRAGRDRRRCAARGAAAMTLPQRDVLTDWLNPVHCMDARRLLADLPPASVDLVCIDPPYNVSKPGESVARNRGQAGDDISLDFGAWDHGGIGWEEFIPLVPRVLTDVGVLVCFYEKLSIGEMGKYLQDEHGWQVRHIGAWVKSNPAPQARKVKWQNGLEFFLVATANKGEGHHYQYREGQSPDYFIRSVNHEHLHPTQKPLDLLEWIVRYWSAPGDVVLDCFCGSGTTGHAAHNIGRECIMGDADEGFCQIASERLAAARLQPRLELGRQDKPTQGCWDL